MLRFVIAKPGMNREQGFRGPTHTHLYPVDPPFRASWRTSALLCSSPGTFQRSRKAWGLPGPRWMPAATP